MVKSLIAIVILLAAVLWAPVWFQLTLFVLAVTFVPKKLLFILPSIVSDVLYAPTDAFRLGNFKMTLIVLALIGIWLIIIRQTRIAHVV